MNTVNTTAPLNTLEAQPPAKKNTSEPQNSFSDTLDLTQAFQNFYEIHQRSQITGVATTEYNEAVKALGIDITDPFSGNKAIEMLKANGYDTDKPTNEAIARYGNTEQTHGNHAYMKGYGANEYLKVTAPETYEKLINGETEDSVDSTEENSAESFKTASAPLNDTEQREQSVDEKLKELSDTLVELIVTEKEQLQNITDNASFTDTLELLLTTSINNNIENQALQTKMQELLDELYSNKEEKE